MSKSTPNHREAILESAQRLILSKGFPATRVDEICAAAEVTKGSFYHHFESKDELAEQLIDHYFTHLTAKLFAGKWSDIADPVDRLMGFLDHTVKSVKGPLLKQGCLLGSFALDLSETHPQIRAEIEKRLNQLVVCLEPHIKAALKTKSSRSASNAGTLSRQFVSVLQGSIVMAKAYGDHGKIAEGVRCYRNMLEAILQN